jgi:hypothetical protein
MAEKASAGPNCTSIYVRRSLSTTRCAGGAKSWIFRGRAREMDLGSFHVLLSQRHEKGAAECRGSVTTPDRPARRSPQREEARSGQGDDLRRMRRRLYRRPHHWLAECEAPRLVAQHHEQRRGPGPWLVAGASCRCRTRHESPGANLADEPRNGQPASRADRSCPRLGHRAWLPEERKPGPLAWSSRQAAPGA